MAFLELALACAARGWAVFPLAGKKPIIPKSEGGQGYKDATLDPEQIRAWWTRWPNANVGIHGPCVLDIDYGLADLDAFNAWRIRNGLPETYTVRTGRRPGFGVQMYFADPIPDVGLWELDGCSGQVKSAGGYVCAAGCIHPSGATYEVLVDAELAPTPDVVRALRKPATAPSNSSKVPKTAWNLPVHEGENRTGFLMEQTGAIRNLGCGKDAILARMQELNDDPEIIADPVDHGRLESTAANCAKFPVPEPDPVPIIGKSPAAAQEPVDWHTHYHTFEEMDNAPPITFLIDGFLEDEAITAVAGPVGQRKSLIAANIAWALCTKESLFDHFEVVKQPVRVLYLCPEMGLAQFTDRIKKIGLLPYVGKTLFCRTMSMAGTLSLKDLTEEELTGAVVIVDTAIRYLTGSESSSDDMRLFAEDIFNLLRRGATAVVLLHHSTKGSVKSDDLSLENAMRGSGELGAFLSSCWATRLHDPEAPYTSPSILKNVKQRDFESLPFNVTSGKDCRLHILGEPGGEGTKLNASDGLTVAAVQVLKDNPDLSNRELVLKLKEAGCPRKKTWVSDKRAELGLTGIKVVITK
jgi:hypothetical protein